MKKHIKLKDCKDGQVYRLKARQLTIGVFRNEDSAFVGIKLKYGYSSLDIERHVDLGGTAAPLELLGTCPIPDLKVGNGVLLRWLDEFMAPGDAESSSQAKGADQRE